MALVTRAFSIAIYAALGALALSGCGSSGSGSSNGSTCSTSGYVYSAAYGCIPQSNCGSGYGLYNGQCVSLSATSTATQTCASGYYWNGYQCAYSSGSNYSSGNSCQASCSAGYVYTMKGCLPRNSACPSCSGTDGYLCYWSVYSLQTGTYY